MLTTVFRGCKQNKTVRKKQMVDAAASNNDTLVDKAVIVYPIHVDYERGGGSMNPRESPTPSVSICDLTSPTQTQTSEVEYGNLVASVRWPSTPFSRNTPRSFSQRIRSYALAIIEVNKYVQTSLA